MIQGDSLRVAIMKSLLSEDRGRTFPTKDITFQERF